MKKWLVLLGSMLLLFACSNEMADVNQLYIKALDELVVTDDGLNHEMAFIAIDMTNFEGVDKDVIKDFFEEKYEVEVLEATLEELRAEGHFDEERMLLDGILLSFSKIEIGNDARIEGSKYRGGNGAFGLEILLHQVDGEWEVDESKMLWISQLPASTGKDRLLDKQILSASPFGSLSFSRKIKTGS